MRWRMSSIEATHFFKLKEGFDHLSAGLAERQAARAALSGVGEALGRADGGAHCHGEGTEELHHRAHEVPGGGRLTTLVPAAL